ncbi:hypothetical protein CUJ84_pRLN3000161 (plasmid) [Rhizobium leguminosarum]|uniref:Uncharacterized protein n=1 Tax=Rhizobium leguminosarum TaxID=384 RepID=A0A2K9ZGB7_RHILE|nr:hypothetical protein CUJ84_pRLN3000161 [Rhizobium leguminosarum]
MASFAGLSSVKFTMPMQSYSPEFAIAESAAGQDIPAPGSSRFHGIVHLHGRLSDPQLGLSQTELVLTSAQWGDVTLSAT